MKEKIYWGNHTKKAKENFPYEGKIVPFEFIKNLALIKAASAKANLNLKAIDKRKAEIIFNIAIEISKGKYSKQFPLSIYQTGSGTSTNMNINEVISNLAKEKYKINIHPNDDVNLSQSSNDVIPSAINLTLIKETKEKLLPEITKLEKEFKKKAKEFKNIITTGRTHFQDAVPVGLSFEFEGYYLIIKKQRKNIENSLKNLFEIPLGGTAVGTGLNSPKGFSEKAVYHLKKLTGLPLKKAKCKFEYQSSIGNISVFSSSLKNFSLEIFKILQDLKIKNYFKEISIPPLQEGSSIMPGKVNPVAIEVLQQIIFDVAGKDTSVSLSSLSGNFELNTFLPLILFSILDSIKILTFGIKTFNEKALKNLKANEEICRRYAENSPSIATPLSLIIGYERTAEIVKRAVEEGKTIIEIIREEKIIPEEKIKEIFNLKKLAFPHHFKDK